MNNEIYHAGPKGLTDLKTARELIDGGELTIEDYAIAWESKWNEIILDPFSLMSHPAMDEICFTFDLDEAKQIAESIDGCVYTVNAQSVTIVTNNEGYPSTRQSISL